MYLCIFFSTVWVQLYQIPITKCLGKTGNSAYRATYDNHFYFIATLGPILIFIHGGKSGKS